MGREPYRIIVVEDHASTAEALRKFLTTIGYKVYIAPDIASARGLAKAIEFDVLLSDLRLPDGTWMGSDGGTKRNETNSGHRHQRT